MFILSDRSELNMKGVKPELIQVARKAITITKVDFGIPETGGLRSTEMQRGLFLEGKSNADGIEILSDHQTGDALDYFAIDPFTKKATWNTKYMAYVACAWLQAACGLGIVVEWGGFWKSIIDMPHIALVKR